MGALEPPAGRPYRKIRSWGRALLTAAPVLAITLYLCTEARNSERLLLEAQTAQQADNAALQFSGFIGAQLAALRDVGNFALGSPPTGDTTAEYDRFVNRLIDDTPGLRAVGWLDAGGRLRHPLPDDEIARRALDPAGLAASAARKASVAGRPVGSDGFDLQSGQPGFVLGVPVRNGQWGASGTVFGAVCLGGELDRLYSQSLGGFWNLEIVDHAGRSAYRAASPADPQSGAVERYVEVADRAWKLLLRPTPLLVSSLRTGAPLRILTLGLAATLVVAVASGLLAHRQVRLGEALRESTRLASAVKAGQQRLANLVNGIEAVVWESDLEMRRFTFVNDYGRKLLGIDPPDWPPEPAAWYERVQPEDRERARENARQARRPGHIYSAEYRMVAADGGTLWVREIIAVIENESGRPTGKRGVVVDITTRVQAEEALRQSQKLESLGVLAGGIAHDFNNLLTTILGNAEMLGRYVGNAPLTPARAHLDKIERTTRRLAELTRQMLAYSGRGKFTVTELDLNAVIIEMTELLSVSTPKNVHVSYDLDPTLPVMEADAAQLRQVVLNLLTNASEAIGEQARGEVIIRTGTSELDAASAEQLFGGQNLEPGRFVRLEVSDTGCGMSAETLSKIFDPFFTTKFTGRGLGLAALRGIVRSHRGGIHIFSQPGEGTVFTLVFPAVEHPHEALPASAGRAAGGSDGWPRTRVLLVDDEEGLRSLMAEALKASGCEVLQAADGEEGVETFRRQASEIDVVVLDLTMPRLNGDEALEQILALRPDACVILCSGYTQEEVHRQFTGRRLAGFLEKPFKPSELIAKIRAVLSERPAPQPVARSSSREYVLSRENTDRQEPADDSSV